VDLPLNLASLKSASSKITPVKSKSLVDQLCSALSLQVCANDPDDGSAYFAVVLAQPVGELFIDTGYRSF